MGVGFLGSRFVGRVEELGRLLGALERTEQGNPVTVLVGGDAGIGSRTRLPRPEVDPAAAAGLPPLPGPQRSGAGYRSTQAAPRHRHPATTAGVNYHLLALAALLPSSPSANVG